MFDEDNEDELAAEEFVTFDRKKYVVSFECYNVPEHNYEEEYRWDDPEGPYEGRFDEFLKRFIELRTEGAGLEKKVSI